MRIQIVENTPRRLQLAISASLPLYAFFGVLFIALGLWCIRLLAVQASIVVEPQRFSYVNTCVWIFDCGSVEATAQDVRAVTMVGHEIQVELPGGTHRLDLPASNGDEKAAIARDIRAALSHPGSSFRHEDGQPVAGLMLGLVCMGSGILILSAIQWVSLIADRNDGALKLTRRLLFYPVRKQEFRLADLQAVIVTPSTLNTGKHIVTSYAVQLRMRGQAGDASVGITFLPMFTETAAADLARIIGGWAGKPVAGSEQS